jgi:hypothetical protein
MDLINSMSSFFVLFLQTKSDCLTPTSQHAGNMYDDGIIRFNSRNPDADEKTCDGLVPAPSVGTPFVSTANTACERVCRNYAPFLWITRWMLCGNGSENGVPSGFARGCTLSRQNTEFKG